MKYGISNVAVSFSTYQKWDALNLLVPDVTRFTHKICPIFPHLSVEPLCSTACTPINSYLLKYMRRFIFECILVNERWVAFCTFTCDTTWNSNGIAQFRAILIHDLSHGGARTTVRFVRNKTHNIIHTFYLLVFLWKITIPFSFHNYLQQILALLTVTITITIT